MAKREEITDVISPEAFDDKNFKKGLVLKFAKATLKITKIDRKNKRVWAQHVSMYDIDTAMGHYGHDVQQRPDGTVFCNDCGTEIDQNATEEGEVKAVVRQREEDDHDNADTKTS